MTLASNDMLSFNSTYYNNNTKVSEFKIKDSYGSYILVVVQPNNKSEIYYWAQNDNKTYEKLNYEIYGNYLSENDVNMILEVSEYSIYSLSFLKNSISNFMLCNSKKISKIKEMCS
jgi:hypothetical protein